MFIVNFIKWLILFTSSLLVDLFGIFIVPIALLCCNESDEHLPKILWPWANDRDGINGDGNATAGWRGPEHANGAERTFWWRCQWLAFRNPANNYGYFCGVSPKGEFNVSGDVNFGITQSTGWIYVTCDNGWCLYAILPYGFGKAVRFAAGWKFWDRDRTPAQIVLVLNPFYNI